MNWNWQESETLEIEFPAGDAVRLTIVSVSGYELGRYYALMREGHERIAEKYSVTIEQFLKSDDEAELQRRVVETQRVHARAYMLATLALTEEKAAGADVWSKSALPDSWISPDTFGSGIPAEAYEAWAEAAIRLNPGQFMAGTGDAEKKGASVTVKRSRS